MRTTINLPSGLAEEAKRRAEETGRTFTSLVIDGLHLVLKETAVQGEVERLPVHGNPAARPLVDISDRDALAAVLDADRLR
ncbi:hypothetical protein [Candidatus Poriferisocius sp.]|uniref:hypothetical protein n=1 Tax=Candidatus Poriferisocius sp. TaxID=3101276 RepID=UPI003B5B0097